jgi:hypothetical protein
VARYQVVKVVAERFNRVTINAEILEEGADPRRITRAALLALLDDVPPGEVVDAEGRPLAACPWQGDAEDLAICGDLPNPMDRYIKVHAVPTMLTPYDRFDDIAGESSSGSEDASEDGYERAPEWARTSDPATGRRVWIDDRGRLFVTRDGGHEFQGYFLCKDPDQIHPRGVRLYGEVQVVVYIEKHRNLVMVGPVESNEFRRVVDLGSAGSALTVFDDAVVFHYDEPGLVELRELPDLSPAVPLAVAADYPQIDEEHGRLRIDGCDVTLLPRGQRRLPPREVVIAAAIAWMRGVVEVDLETAEMLVGAAIGPAFAPEPSAERYEELSKRRRSARRRLDSPVYLYERLTEESPRRASEFLAAIDQLSARAPSTVASSHPSIADDDGTAATIAVAIEHLCRRARAWANACRTGEPEAALSEARESCPPGSSRPRERS